MACGARSGERMLLGCISAVIDAAARALSYWPGGGLDRADGVLSNLPCFQGVFDIDNLKWNAQDGKWLLQTFTPEQGSRKPPQGSSGSAAGD